MSFKLESPDKRNPSGNQCGSETMGTSSSHPNPKTTVEEIATGFREE
jgi:hypothetical protein